MEINKYVEDADALRQSSPGGPGSVLPPEEGSNLARRMPGWLPDLWDLPVPNPVGGVIAFPQAFFIEEMLGLTSAPAYRGEEVKVPFAVPLSGVSNSKWILGHRLHELHPKTGAELPPALWSEFNQWLRKLSKLARNYNASLYRLRRLHLKHQKNKWDMDPLPTDGLKQWDIDGAEKEFMDRAFDLKGHLKPNPDPNSVPRRIVEMIQVNGYIVSFRVVDIETRRNPNFREFGGSESSHISLSSAFSSYWEH